MLPADVRATNFVCKASRLFEVVKIGEQREICESDPLDELCNYKLEANSFAGSGAIKQKKCLAPIATWLTPSDNR